MVKKDVTVDNLKELARQLRKDIIQTTVWAGSGHVGGAMSAADYLVALYFKYLNIDPKDCNKPDRDRFILSKGHSAVGYIPCLALAGFFPKENLKRFNHFMSPFGMHPDALKVPGCDCSTGSLGHGLPIGVGICLGAKLQKQTYKTVVMLGDGECCEGSNYEAMMAASHYKLDNLIAIVDRNGLMIDGKTEDVMALEPFADKWRAFGWNVIEVADGNDMQQVCDSLDQAWEGVEGKPTVIIAKTIKGKGVSFMEDDVKWHYGAIDSEKAAIAFSDIEKGI
ncbi:MAG: transketolase [Christensenellales bacterium]|jgi:transketolase|nr:transketolase [Clostridiales bacterium]